MRFNRATIALPVAFAGMLAVGQVAQAQNQQSNQPPPQYQNKPPQHKDFSKDQIKSFASANENIRQIGAKYSKRIKSAGDKQDAQKLRQEAQQKMAGAVQDEGLTVNTYNQIAQAARKDPALVKRIQKMLAK